MAIKSLDELGIKPVNKYENPSNGGRKIKSLEELGIQPVRRQQDLSGATNNNNRRLKSLEELGIQPINRVEHVKQEPSRQVEGAPKESKEELSYGDRALQLARGFSNIPAIGADLVNNYVAAPILNAAGGAAELASKGAGYVSKGAEDVLQHGAEAAYKARDFYKESNLTGNVSDAFNELAGKDITPKDTTGKILNATGEFAFPFSNVAKGAKGVGQAASAVGKHLGVAAGGGAALEGTKDYRITEEGTTGRVVEDFLQTVMGMSLADKGLSAAKRKIIDNTEKTLSKIANNTEQKALKLSPSEDIGTLRKGLAKALSLGANPNIEANAAAAAEGVQLPFEVALNGRAQKFLANTGLKSLFVTKGYNNVIEHADRDMINAVRNKINTISPTEIEGFSASGNALSYLQGEKTAIGKEVRRLYEEKAFPLLRPQDEHIPKNTIHAVQDMIKNVPELTAADPGAKAKALASNLKTIGEAWGFIPPGKDLARYADDPKFLQIVADEFSNNPKSVPVKGMIAQLRATFERTKYERDIPGLPNLYNRLVGALQKDIESTTNKEFLKEYRAANQYFKQNEVDRLRSDMANSIMNGEVPKEAFKYMGDVGQIRKLSNVLGTAPAAKEILSSLKRAKLEDVLVKNILDSSGTISYANFSNMFNKAPEKQALLKELLGEQYPGMKKLSEVSQQFVTAGKDFGNPSRTTLSAADKKGVIDVIKVLGNTAATVAGSTALHGMTLTAGIEPLGIWALSRAASDKKIVNTAIKYAEAAKNDRLKDAEILGNRLSRMAGKVLKSQWDEIKNHPQASLVITQEARDEFVEKKKKKIKNGK